MAKEHSPLLFTFEHIPLSHHYHPHSPWAGKDLQSPFIVHLGGVHRITKEEEAVKSNIPPRKPSAEEKEEWDHH